MLCLSGFVGLCVSRDLNKPRMETSDVHVRIARENRSLHNLPSGLYLEVTACGSGINSASLAREIFPLNILSKASFGSHRCFHYFCVCVCVFSKDQIDVHKNTHTRIRTRTNT